MRSRVIERIRDLPASEWNALDHRGYPFLRHEFLTALEDSGCIGFETGWRAHFIVLEDDAGIAAAAPAWLKDHSYGEFVFDFAWARLMHDTACAITRNYSSQRLSHRPPGHACCIARTRR